MLYLLLFILFLTSTTGSVRTANASEPHPQISNTTAFPTVKGFQLTTFDYPVALDIHGTLAALADLVDVLASSSMKGSIINVDATMINAKEASRAIQQHIAYLEIAIQMAQVVLSIPHDSTARALQLIAAGMTKAIRCNNDAYNALRTLSRRIDALSQLILARLDDAAGWRAFRRHGCTSVDTAAARILELLNTAKSSAWAAELRVHALYERAQALDDLITEAPLLGLAQDEIMMYVISERSQDIWVQLLGGFTDTSINL